MTTRYLINTLLLLFASHLLAVAATAQTAEDFFTRGLKQGDCELSVAEYSNAIRLDPNFEEAYYHRGLCYAVLDKHDLAFSDFDKAVQIKPDYEEVYFARGRDYSTFACYAGVNRFGKDDVERAIADFSKIIQLNDLYVAPASYERGVCHSRKGDYDKSIADYTRAIQVEPDSSTYYFARGQDYYYGKKNLDLARADFQKALELKPGDPNATKMLDLINKKGMLVALYPVPLNEETNARIWLEVKRLNELVQHNASNDALRIISYPGAKSRPGEAAAELAELKTYLIRQGISIDRIKFLVGGKKPSPIIEVWQAPVSTIQPVKAPPRRNARRH